MANTREKTGNIPERVTRASAKANDYVITAPKLYTPDANKRARREGGYTKKSANPPMSASGKTVFRYDEPKERGNEEGEIGDMSENYVPPQAESSPVVEVVNSLKAATKPGNNMKGGKSVKHDVGPIMWGRASGKMIDLTKYPKHPIDMFEKEWTRKMDLEKFNENNKNRRVKERARH